MSIKTPKLADDQAVSAGVVASIEDLLTEILLRLPLRVVIRCKTVSKQWKSIISKSEFWKMRNPNPDPATGIYLPWTRSSSIDNEFSRGVENLSFYADKSTIPSVGRHYIMQSCNGLMLCSWTVKLSHMYCSCYYVYNPTTMKFLTLPELVCHDRDSRAQIFSMSLAFDPNISPYYKVICVLDSETAGLYIYIYSSDTGLWTSSPDPPYHLNVNCGSGVYWNGAIHWMRAESYFNIKDQTLKAMPLPSIAGLKQNYYFGESYGHLYCTKIRSSKTFHDIHVYELQSDYSGWFLKYFIDLKDQLSMKSVISLVSGKNEADSFLVLQSEGKVLRYNLVSGTFDQQELHDFQGASCKRAFQYIEYLGDV